MDKGILHCPACDEEIYLAFYQIRTNKVPEPEQLPPFFFQKNREVMGLEVI